MKLRHTAIGSLAVACLSAAALTSVVAPATAAPAAKYTVSSVPAGVTSGGELALDPGRGKLFVTNNDFVLTSKGGSNFSVKPQALDPKVSIFSLAAQRPVGSIDYSGQPWGAMLFGPVPVLPTPQIPDGIAIDTVHGKVITSNTHPNGISVVSMNAKTTSAANLIPVPAAHPMGIAVDAKAARAYVALNSSNVVLIVDTVTGRRVGTINDLYAAAFIDIDASRHRVYVGNADYTNKKNNFVAVIDTRTNRVVKKIVTPSNSRPKVDAKTGRIFVASFDTGKISVIDPNSLSIVKTIDTHSTPNKLAIDSQRRVVYVSNLQKRTVTVIDADTYRVVTTIPTGVAVNTIVVDEKTGVVYGTQHQAGNLTVIRPAR